MDPAPDRDRRLARPHPLAGRRPRRLGRGLVLGLGACLALTLAAGASLPEEDWLARAESAERALFASTASSSDLDALLALLEDLEAAGALAASPEPTPDERERAEAYRRAARALAILPPPVLPAGFDRAAALRKGLRAAVIVDDDEKCAFLAQKLAQELFRDQRLDEAEKVLHEALALDGILGMTPYLWVTVARIARYRGHLGVAAERMERAEQALAAISPEWSQYRAVRCVLDGARVELDLSLGLPDRAAVALADEERLAAELGDPSLRLNALRHRAELYLITTRPERLARHVEEALASPLLAWDPGAGLELLFLASVARAADPDGDVEGWRRARDDLADVVDSPHVADAIRARARVWSAELCLREGDLEAARAEIAAAREAFEHLDGDDARRQPLEDESFLAALDVKVALADRASTPEALAALLARTERAYGFLLERWRRAPVRSGGLGFLRLDSRRVLPSELVRLTLHVDPGADLRALDQVVRAQAMGSWVRRSGHEPRATAVILAELTRGDVGVLVYLPGPDRTHLFAADAGGVETYELDSRDVLERLRERFEEAVTAPPGPGEAWDARDLRMRARALAEALLPAEARERMADWSGVQVVGAQLLGYLPFEYLDLGGAALGERWPVAYVPSLPVADLLLRRGREPQGEGVLVLAAPTVDPAVTERWPRAGPLELPEARLRRLGDRAGPAFALRTGAAADRTALRGAGSVSAWCFLTHGVFDARRERGAGLVLAPGHGSSRGRATGAAPDGDGVLWCEDVDGLAAPPVVVLAVCEAGRGPARTGDDSLAHLGGAFLGAGASVVVLPTRAVAVHAVERWLPEVLAGLATDDVSVAESLRRARRALAEHPDTAHPFHGLVHAVGLAHRTRNTR